MPEILSSMEKQSKECSKSSYWHLSIQLVKNTVGYPQGSCRFTPTCSEYVKETFRKLSLPKALFYSIVRILRCNPLSKGGYDPVREKGFLK